VRVLALPALLGLLASCGVPEPVEQAAVATGAEVHGTGPLDALSRRFGRLRSRMRERGYVEEVGLKRMFVMEGHGVAVPVDVATGRCVTFVALAGSGVRDLDLRLYDGDGVEAAADSIAGEGGLVHVCPQPLADGAPTAPHYFVSRAVEGSGAVVAGAFVSDPGAGEGFEGLFDGVLAPQVPFRGVEERLATSRTLLRSRGLLPMSEPLLDSIVEGAELRFVAELEPGRCYVAVARGDDSLTDIDVLLFAPGGAEVARDIGADAEPSLEYCPEAAGRYTFGARAFEGTGAMGLLVLGGPAAVEPEDGPGGGAEEDVAAEGSEPAPEDADDPMVALGPVASLLVERGYAAPSYVTTDGWVAPGEVRTHDVLLGGGCALVVGAAGRPETDLDLYLAEPSGAAVARDTGVHPVARVHACLEQPGGVRRLTVKAYGRRGRYALAVFAAPEGISDVRTLRLEEATASFRQRGYALTARTERSLEQGEIFAQPLNVRPGSCLAVAAAGDLGVTDVDLILRDLSGALVASDSGPEPYAAIGHCAEETPESLTIQVLAYRGAGSVKLERLEGSP